jgi:hypothetical protein
MLFHLFAANALFLGCMMSLIACTKFNDNYKLTFENLPTLSAIVDQLDSLAFNTLFSATFNVLGGFTLGRLFWSYENSRIT